MSKLLALIVTVAACTHAPAPVPVIDTSVPIVLPERVGGAVNKALLKASNVDVGAVTLPGLPPIFLKDGNDRCLVVHEEEHVRQQKADGDGPWTLRYLRDLFNCLASVPIEQRRAEYYRCYASVGYEAQAFKAQRACEASP